MAQWLVTLGGDLSVEDRRPSIRPCELEDGDRQHRQAQRQHDSRLDERRHAPAEPGDAGIERRAYNQLAAGLANYIAADPPANTPESCAPVDDSAIRARVKPCDARPVDGATSLSPTAG
jgi:hypothetical protein